MPLARHGHHPVVRLLEHGARPDMKSKRGRTPLCWAAVNGYGAFLKVLIEIGSPDADSRDNDGLTPLSWAASNGYKASNISEGRIRWVSTCQIRHMHTTSFSYSKQADRCCSVIAGGRGK